MKVILRHPGSGLYYAGRRHWVGHPGAALDLKTVERAIDFTRKEPLDELELHLIGGSTSREVVVQVEGGKAGARDARELRRRLEQEKAARG